MSGKTDGAARPTERQGRRSSKADGAARPTDRQGRRSSKVRRDLPNGLLGSKARRDLPNGLLGSKARHVGWEFESAALRDLDLDWICFEVIDMKSPVRGRFAPTPSGYMHLGNALTAILAWLQVRRLNGEFILRIEDIDVQRLHPPYVVALLEDLKWLGVDWDEGPDIDGPHGPYRQQHRTYLYEQALAALKAKNLLYPCFCSRKDLKTAAIAPHGLASEGPVYSGRCRTLSDEERAIRSVHKSPSWRFMLPDEGMTFTDLVRGPESFPPGSGGDFVVHRADGVFGYQLAVAVDDADMGITHVLRGDDLLDSTPRQLYLYRALGLTPPVFAHVPMVYTSDGQRLAKRDESVTIRSLREQGFSSDVVVGYLAWMAGLIDRPEAIPLRELVEGFDVSHVVRHRFELPENWLQTLRA